MNRVGQIVGMWVGSAVIVVACSSGPTGSAMTAAGGAGSEAEGGQPSASSGRSSGNAGDTASAGLEMVPDASAAEPPVPPTSVKGECTVVGPDYAQPASQAAGIHTYNLFAVASFSGKSRNELATHTLVYLGATAAAIPNGTEGYYSVFAPMVKDGSALIGCGLRNVDPANGQKDSFYYSSVEFVYTP